MADGQGPKPAFYVAVLLVVIGLVALGLWRMGKIGPERRRIEVLPTRRPDSVPEPGHEPSPSRPRRPARRPEPAPSR